MRAAVYCRVSSEDQVRGYSLQTQEAECRRRAGELGAEDVAAFVERGVSGEALDRPALNGLREALRRRAFALVVMYDPDRLARKLSIQLLLTEEIARAGARLEFVAFDWQDTPDGRLFYALRGAIAEYEREKILERTLRGRRAKVAQGGVINGPKPFGYRFDPDTDTLRPDPATAPVVRQMFAWAGQGLGVRSIAQRLADMGIPPPGGGANWWPETASRILHSATYAGRLHLNRYSITKSGGGRRQLQRPREEWVVAAVPPLVDEAVWEAAQRALERNARSARGRRAHPCLLRGFLVCGACGRHLAVRTRVKPNRAYSYYHCTGARASRAASAGGAGSAVCPQGMAIRAEVLDEAVWQRVSTLLAGLPAEDPVEEAGGELALVQAQADATERARQRTLRAYQRALIDEPTFDREMRRLQAAAADLRRQAEALPRRRPDGALPPDPGTGPPLDLEGRRRVLALLLQRVVIRPDGPDGVIAELHGHLPFLDA